MPLTSGFKIGPYEILAPLGAGGMSEVYRARDTRLSREVAVKMLPETFARDPERLARFRREAQTLASLNHSNIGAIYGFEEVDATPYLVLELVAGETLADRLRRGPLPIREALPLILQIASAVEAAHERGVVHRDLKPQNVMITPSGTAKVLDFGLAKGDPAGDPDGSLALTGITTEGWIVGTVAYMSPEQARGAAVDRRSDIWSFGCIVFECLTGSPPFAGATRSDILARILEREPEWTALPASAPPRLRDVLRRCLRKDADARPRDIRDVRLELAELAERRGGEREEKSIAVLPFENLSGTDDEYFADGVTDEILNALAHLEGLRVAARSSSYSFKGKREDLRSVGEKLDVATVLEGSVRRAGSRLRITAQLVNAADGYQLWSERYDREMTDVFEVQEEIAKAIAMRLRGTLHAGEADRGGVRRGTKNLEAYELFLKGRALQNNRGRFLPEAIACFERAIELDPQFAEPMAWLSDSYRLLGTFGDAPYATVMPEAKRLAERALAIDADLSEAWCTLACVAEQYEWDFTRADEMWERALTIDPKHGRARSQRALWAICRARFTPDETEAELRRALEDEPLNGWVRAMSSHLLGFLGKHDQSIEEGEQSVRMDPDSYFSAWNLMRAYAWAGDHERAIQLAPSVLVASNRHPWGLGTLAWSYGKVGQRDLARAVFDEMEGRSRHQFVSPFWLTTGAAAAGLPDQALRFVDRAVSERDPLVIWGRISPFWDEARKLPGLEERTQPVWNR